MTSSNPQCDFSHLAFITAKIFFFYMDVKDTGVSTLAVAVSPQEQWNLVIITFSYADLWFCYCQYKNCSFWKLNVNLLDDNKSSLVSEPKMKQTRKKKLLWIGKEGMASVSKHALSMHIVWCNLYHYTGWPHADTSYQMCCIMVVSELNPIDNQTVEKELPFQLAKCFHSVKWLAAFGKVYWVAYMMPGKDGVITQEIGEQIKTALCD